jgi:S1/P1 Nuclease
LPLGSSHYPDTSHSDPHDPVLPFTGSHDIVHMIQRCIEVLEAQSESAQFTRLQALRWLLHLVEDLHQPLHVASGYYSTLPSAMEHPKPIDDPVAVLQQQAKNDRGGNVLLFLKHPHCPTVRTQENLHSVWDSCLVDMVNGAKRCVSHSTPQDVTHLAGMLKRERRSAGSEGYKTGGDIHHWAEQWATDTLKVAQAQVFNIELTDGCVIRSNKAPHEPLHVQGRIAKPTSKKRYLQSHKDTAKIQLIKAAVRLADLLNHINWK